VVSAARNRILGNAVGVNNTTPGSAGAENNWWGCNAGPGSAGCDTTVGAVDSDPRLVLGVSASPTTIETGGATSQIDASVRRNSAGEVQPSPFFASVPTAFGATLGTIAPAAGLLADGVAPATLTSGSEAGTSTVTATLDNQPATATSPSCGRRRSRTPLLTRSRTPTRSRPCRRTRRSRSRTAAFRTRAAASSCA
jgi:hypothetical protein